MTCPDEFLSGSVVDAARALLGWRVRSGGVMVRLTETEAYGGAGADPASHAHRGRTVRNAVMFGPPGFLYVYLVYGMHWCANVVCGAEGEASAVLLRAGEVVAGVEIARRRRGEVSRDSELARGPGRLTVALGVSGATNGTYLLGGSGPVTLLPPDVSVDPASIAAGPRVGVTSGADTPWRFWLPGELSVSAYRGGGARKAQ